MKNPKGQPKLLDPKPSWTVPKEWEQLLAGIANSWIILNSDNTKSQEFHHHTPSMGSANGQGFFVGILPLRIFFSPL